MDPRCESRRADKLFESIPAFRLSRDGKSLSQTKTLCRYALRNTSRDLGFGILGRQEVVCLAGGCRMHDASTSALLVNDILPEKRKLRYPVPFTAQ